MEIKWLDQIELANKVETNPDEFTPWLRIYMSKHFEQISGTITA
jgi:isopentenyldiphosphate isomerase